MGSLAAGVGGCSTQAACNPAVEVCDGAQGGRVFSGDESIRQVQAGCCRPLDEDPHCGAQGTWWYSLYIDGSVRGATVQVTQEESLVGGRVEESHSLPVDQRDPDGFWEQRYLELSVVDDEQCQRPAACADDARINISTAFSCVEDAEERWHWRVSLTDRNGDEVACATWGVDAALHAPECRVVAP